MTASVVSKCQMDQTRSPPNQQQQQQLYPAYSLSADLPACTRDWINHHDHLFSSCSSVAGFQQLPVAPSAPPSLQHFDLYQSYTPVPLSMSQGQSHGDIDFSLLVPPPAVHYNTSSPSPCSVSVGGDQMVGTTTGSCAGVIQQQQQTVHPSHSVNVQSSNSPIDHPEPPTVQHSKKSKTSSTEHRPTQKTGKAAKRHTQKRVINRPSPIFPSCSTPIAMIGQQSHANKHEPQTLSPSRTLSSDCLLLPSAIHKMPNITTGAITGVSTNISSLSITASTHQTTSNRSLSILTNQSTMQQLKDIESKILKLQAERGRLLKSAEERSQQLSGAQYICPSRGPSIGLYLSSIEQLRDLENGLIEEGNLLMYKIGRLYSTLDSAIENTISLCSSGQPLIHKFSECFPYINSLLASEKETIKIVECPNDTVNGSIQLELCHHDKHTSSSSGSLSIVLENLNKVINCSQLVQVHAREITQALKTIKCKLQEIRDSGLEVCATSIESRVSAQAVTDGNLAVVNAAQIIWERTIQYGATTITTITKSLSNSYEESS